MDFKNWLYKRPTRLLLFAISFSLSLAAIEWWYDAPKIKAGQDYDEMWRSALIVVVYYSIALFIHQSFSLVRVGFMKKSILYFLLFVLFSVNFLSAFIWYSPMGTTVLAIISLIIQIGIYLYLFKNINSIDEE